MTQEFDFQIVARREVGMPSLRGQGMKMTAIVVQNRLPETGPGRDQCLVAGMALDALVEGAELVVFECEDAVGRGFEIVKQNQRIELERAPQFAAVDHP